MCWQYLLHLQVSSVLLSDGSSLPADIVVVGAGARPASSLFKGQLDVDKTGGILVDGYFKVCTDGDAAQCCCCGQPAELQTGELLLFACQLLPCCAHLVSSLFLTRPLRPSSCGMKYVHKHRDESAKQAVQPGH